MKYVKTFGAFNESHSYDDEFKTEEGNDILDIIEQELLTKEFDIIHKDDELFSKLEQILDTQKGELVLELDYNILTKYDEPFEFIKWDILGTDSKVIETNFVIKNIDKEKV